MTKFSGRADKLLFFTNGDRGVIVDSEFGIVVGSGQSDVLLSTASWTEGEYSEIEYNLAASAFATMSSTVSEPTGRLYTIPKGVQAQAKQALQRMNTFERGGTESSVHTASLLASGGQVGFEKLRHMAKYFSRHAGDKFSDAWEPTRNGEPSAAQITWGMWGGDTGNRWASAILERESEKALAAGGAVVPSLIDSQGDPFLDAFELDPEEGPEFLARVRMDGSGVDRLYKIDTDGAVYLWDDGTWDTLGVVGGDIYAYDRELDSSDDLVEKTHLVVDPASAVLIGSRLQEDPFGLINIEDIDSTEASLIADAIDSLDWELIDSALVAAGPVFDPNDPENGVQARSARATTQLRDGTGRFATMGQRVMINGNPASTGVITKVSPETGNVHVQLESGGTVMIPAKAVSGIGAYTATIPGRPVAVPNVDTSGILAEPRTPINRIGAQIPGTLPAMTSQDLHSMLNDWPAWVRGQRDAFLAAPSAPYVHVQGKNSLDTGKYGSRLQERTGINLIKDAYDHPLLAKWLRASNANGKHPNSLWYQPHFSIQAAGAEVEMTPETSDVVPVYLAVVASDDPRAVVALVALVPASSSSLAPMTYARKEGKWDRDPKLLRDLQSATPPPVVPLDSEALADVLQQVDSTQEDAESADTDADLDTELHPARPEVDLGLPPVNPAKAPEPVTAGLTLDETLVLLWGPNESNIRNGVVAAGGLDRNRGGADKLRKYWTRGIGGAKIRWGTPGDWTRCVRHLAKYLGPRAKGYCALRHKEMTGMWTGDKRNRALATRETGYPMYSTEFVVTEDQFFTRATVAAQAADVRARVLGVTAGGDDKDRKPGAEFIIPLLLPLGVESGDRRIIHKDADVSHRDLPVALMWQIKTDQGHDRSVIVGRIDSMEIGPDGVRNARGVFDTNDWAKEAQRMIHEGFLRGVSADMDKFEAENESTLSEKDSGDGTDKIEKSRVVVHNTRIMGATLVAKPAFQECQIFLLEDLTPEKEDEDFIMIPDGIYVETVDPIDASALVAAGSIAESIPVEPPLSWFENPGLRQSTPLTVSDDGRVFGHIATWDTNHMGYNTNLKPPRSRSNYAYFQTGTLRTAEGQDVNVGQLTLAGGHPGLEFSAREAVKHYDDTASAVADVRAGEDQFGIWVSGGLRPGVSPEQIRTLRASAPSGDWRSIKGRLELVAVCQVNVPGFPIARTLVAGGQSMSLVAAGASTLAHLQSDPVAEMSARLERLEQFTASDLDAKAAPIREKFAQVRALRDAELSARAQQISERVSASTNFSYVPHHKRENLEAVSDRSDLRARIAEFASNSGSSAGRAQRDREIKKIARSIDPTIVNGEDRVSSPDAIQPSEDSRIKYTPKTQPRNADGKFRLVLARLRDNIGDNGNQEVMDKIKQVENLDNAGNYKEASLSAADLANTLNRIDTRSMDPRSIATIKAASRELSTTVANLPLPFANQSQKIRFTDLPPVLRELAQSLVSQVQTKLGLRKSAEATADLRNFMAGGDFYSQSNVSSQLNKMLHLLI